MRIQFFLIVGSTSSHQCKYDLRQSDLNAFFRPSCCTRRCASSTVYNREIGSCYFDQTRFENSVLRFIHFPSNRVCIFKKFLSDSTLNSDFIIRGIFVIIFDGIEYLILTYVLAKSHIFPQMQCMRIQTLLYEAMSRQEPNYCASEVTNNYGRTLSGSNSNLTRDHRDSGNV